MLAKKLKQLSKETLERLRFVSQLSERLYQGGSLNVKKSDYLRSKLSVNFLESIYQKMDAQKQMAETALANAMGLSYRDSVKVVDESFETPVMDADLDALVESAYKFNPDFSSIKLALQINDAKIDEVKSGYLPQLAFLADTQYIYNDYEYGVINETNRDSWSVGVALKWSLFNGMRTSNELEQSKLEKLQLQDQTLLLQEGVAVQMKQAFLQMDSSYKEYLILLEATQTAKENRELNTRAYREDMVETKDVIEAQLFESFTSGNFYRAEYDYAIAKANIDFIVGASIESVLNK